MKEKILNKAQEKFFKFGYSKVRVDELAEELGISKKTVYNHFRGKEDILLKVIDKMRNDFESDILEIQQNKDLQYIHIVQEALTELGKWVSRIALFTNDLKKHLPSAYAKLTTIRKDVVLKHSTNILNKGVEKGYLKHDSKLHMALFMFLATSERMIDEDYHERLPIEMIQAFPTDASERFKTIVNIIYEGLKSDIK